MKRTPPGASREKPLPRPGTTSSVSAVCFQNSNWSLPMKNGAPATTPRKTSRSPILKSPRAKHIGELPSQQPPD